MPDVLGDRHRTIGNSCSLSPTRPGATGRKKRDGPRIPCGAEQDSVSANEELLRDIRNIFDADRAERMAMAELLRRLIEDESAPWATWAKGKPMTARQLGEAKGVWHSCRDCCTQPL